MKLDHLTRAPFGLDREALAWVEATAAGLSQPERVAQLFNLGWHGEDPGAVERFVRLAPGGITRFFGPDGAAEQARLAALQDAAKVPLLVSADLEGSRMSLPFGTAVPNPLALAAVDDVELTREISAIMAREARAVGVNWSFTPVLDINAAFRSSIVATRGYGSDPERIARHALAQIETFQSHGLAATAKHWPGEGYDERDQHLVTTINPLSISDWKASFGKLYGAAIDAGVMAVMSAHIAFPAYVRAHLSAPGVEAFRPASISALLNQRLLREELGFNGLIVSDASEMAGLTAWEPPRVAKADVIATGCDMVLFSSDPEAEMASILAALDSGQISPARFDDALSRVLGLKAALGLHRDRAAAPHAIGAAEDRRLAEAAMLRAPTLVKDVQNLLPLDPERHRRVLVISGGIVEPLRSARMPLVLPDLLREEGFAVTDFTPGMAIERNAFDLVLYLFGEETLLTRGRIFLDWLGLAGDFVGAMQRLWHDIPTAMISFGYPYYLYDAPRVPTYINAYSTLDQMQAAVRDLLLGRHEWNRTSPVDPFSGAPDARY